MLESPGKLISTKLADSDDDDHADGVDDDDGYHDYFLNIQSDDE